MNCRICGNKDNNEEYKGSDVWFGFKEVFKYFQCSKCSCLQIEEYPKNISAYYPGDKYYSFQLSVLSNRKSLFRRAFIHERDKYALFRKGFLGRLLFFYFPTDAFKMLNLLNINQNTRILDVGCGNGEFLYRLRELGLKKLLGTDPYLPKELKYENGLHILNKEMIEITGNYDVVCFKNSFEHMANPVRVLKSVFRLLDYNGHCVIRIPIVSSYAWRHYKEYWIQLDAPRHFYLHSIKSMQILASKTGFELCNIVYDSGSFQFLGSEQLLKNIHLNDELSWRNNPKKSIFTNKQILSYKKKAIDLDANKEGDVAIFYLRKKGQ